MLRVIWFSFLPGAPVQTIMAASAREMISGQTLWWLSTQELENLHGAFSWFITIYGTTTLRRLLCWPHCHTKVRMFQLSSRETRQGSCMYSIVIQASPFSRSKSEPYPRATYPERRPLRLNPSLLFHLHSRPSTFPLGTRGDQRRRTVKPAGKQ